MTSRIRFNYIRHKILIILRAENKPMTTRRIWLRTQSNYMTILKYLNTLKKEGTIKQINKH